MNRAFREFFTAERLRIVVEVLAMLNVILLVSMGIYAVKIHNVTVANHKLADQGAQAHDSLCALRGDFKRNIALTEDYLRTHPEKTILGVPRATFKASLAGRKLTLKSLSELTCSEEQSSTVH